MYWVSCLYFLVILENVDDSDSDVRKDNLRDNFLNVFTVLFSIAIVVIHHQRLPFRVG